MGELFVTHGCRLCAAFLGHDVYAVEIPYFEDNWLNLRCVYENKRHVGNVCGF